MLPQSKQPKSLFDSILAHAGACPTAEQITAAAPKILADMIGKTISDLSFDLTTDKITVSIDVYDQTDNEDTETIIINHDDMLCYAQDNDLLKCEAGGHSCDTGQYVDSTHEYEIGYTEWLQDHLTGEIVKEYLIEKKLVTYEWDDNAV